MQRRPITGRRLSSLSSGGLHGSRNIVVVTGRADPGYYLTRTDLALTMSHSTVAWRDESDALARLEPVVALNTGVSAISWAPIIGGAVAATAVTLVLVILGSGFGLAWVSPTGDRGPTATGFALTAAVWLIVVQWLSAASGGYITGRLRTKWAGTHTHEVFFRDTAHGLLTWALSTLLVAALVALTSSALLGAGVRAAAQVSANAAQGAAQGAAGNGITTDARSYDIDMLFRSDQPNTQRASDGDARAEAGRILAQGVTGTVADTDRDYLAQMVAVRTGMQPADAHKRVDDVIAREKAAEAKAQEVAEAARKATARASVITGVSMLIGAFIACAAAALGGSLRDEHP